MKTSARHQITENTPIIDTFWWLIRTEHADFWWICGKKKKSASEELAVARSQEVIHFYWRARIFSLRSGVFILLPFLFSEDARSSHRGCHWSARACTAAPLPRPIHWLPCIRARRALDSGARANQETTTMQQRRTDTHRARFIERETKERSVVKWCDDAGNFQGGGAEGLN